MTMPDPGNHRCFVSDRFFYVALSAGTSVVLKIKGGHISGTLNGHAISGHGSVEYTYNAAAAKLVRTNYKGTGSGPLEIPITLEDLMTVVYLPVGCNADISLSTSGVPEATTDWKHKKDSYDMTGKTESFTLIINQTTGTNPCDLTGMDGDICGYDCSVHSGAPDCEQECLDIQDQAGC